MDELEFVFTPAVRAEIRAASLRGSTEAAYRLGVLLADGDYPRDEENADQQRIRRAFRAAWDSYLAGAKACGLFEGQDGDDVLARLRGVDATNFRSAMAECMASWYLAAQVGLAVRPKPRGRDARRLEFSSQTVDGELLFEVKAPYVPPHTEGVMIGDDAPVLQAALDHANRQFARGQKNVLLLVPELRIPVHSMRRQLVRAFIAEEVLRFDLDRERRMFVNPRREMDPRGRFTRLWRDRGFFAPRYRRVSAVLSLERRFTDRAAYSVAVAEERFALPNTVDIDHVALLVHNPYALVPISHQVFSAIPQLIREQGHVRWTDGAAIV
jgi:hypothetical protein